MEKPNLTDAFYKTVADRLMNWINRDIKAKDVDFDYWIDLDHIGRFQCYGLTDRLNHELSKSLSNYEVSTSYKCRYGCRVHVTAKTGKKL